MNIVVILSGGLDSSVLLASLVADGNQVKALSIDYGQRHRKELVSAVAIANHYQVEHRIADLRAISPLLAGSSQTSTDIPVPEGHYAEESMKLTVVPNRNMIMLAVAAGWAISLKYDAVAFGAHAGDHAVYPDCRPEFADALNHTLSLADWHTVQLLRPFLSLTKTDIAALGARLNVPFEKTWTCYKGGEKHCGKCGTCVERIEAFHDAGLSDPTIYQ